MYVIHVSIGSLNIHNNVIAVANCNTYLQIHNVKMKNFLSPKIVSTY